MIEQHLVVKKGSKFELVVSVVDAVGTPIEMPGWTALMHIRDERSEDGVLLASYETGTELTVTGSQVLIDVPGDDTASYDWTDGYYDLFVIEPSGEPHCVIQGTVRVDRRITVIP